MHHRRIIASPSDRGVTSARTTGISKNAGARDVTSTTRCDFSNAKQLYDANKILTI